MTSVADIRPHVTPMPFSRALEDVEVLEWVPAGTAAAAAQSTPVSGVTVSNRDLAQGWIFVAVPGLTQHGIRFAPAAAGAGAVAVLTDPEGARLSRELQVDLPLAVVADPRAAAPLVAATVYGHPAEHLTTMAVTGTNGKTTTTYLMRAALRAAHPRPAMCNSVELVVGDVHVAAERTTAEAPVIERVLALAQQEGLGAAVVETSAHALSLNRVDGIVFDVAAFTNLQHDHLDYYGDMEHYFEAKRILFTPAHCRQGVVCVDDEWGRRLATEAEVPVVTVSALTDTPADWSVRDVHREGDSARTTFTLVDPDGVGHEVRCPLLGEVNVQNCALAVVSAVRLGLDVEDVIPAVEACEPVPGRMVEVNPVHPGQPLVVVDYAYTPEALEWSLGTARGLVGGHVCVVFGSEGDRDASKREDVGSVAARCADTLWVTDESPRDEDPQAIRDQLLTGIRRVRPGMEHVTEVTTCRRDAVRRAILDAGPEDVVMVTGKGAEPYQIIQGIEHAYNDVPVAREVLAQDPRVHAV